MVANLLRRLVSVACIGVASICVAAAQNSATDPRDAQAHESFERGDYATAIALWQAQLGEARSRHDERGIATYAFRIGGAQDRAGDRAAAVQAYREALAASRARKNVRGAAIILYVMSIDENALGRPDDARRDANAALAAFRALHLRSNEADTLNTIGLIEAKDGHYRASLAAMRQAYAMHRSAGDGASAAGDLSIVVTDESSLGMDTSVDRDAAEGARAFAAIHDASGVARMLFMKAGVDFGLHRYTAQFDAAQRALAFHRAAGEVTPQAADLRLGGIALQHLGRNAEALAALNAAAAIDRDAHSDPGVAADLVQIGSANKALGRADEALAALRRALDLETGRGAVVARARTLGVLSEVEWQLGDYPTALLDARTALAMDLARGSAADEAVDRIGIAHVEDATGDFAAAVREENAALALCAAAHDVAGRAAAEAALAGTLTHLGRYERARGLFEEAETIYRAGNDRASEALVLNDRAILESQTGHDDEALRLLHAAEAVEHSLGDRQGEATARANAGATEEALGRYPEAVRDLTDAIATDRELRLPSPLAAALGDLGVVLSDGGRFDEARRSYDEALAIAERLGSRESRGAWLNDLGLLEQSLGRYDAALPLFRQSEAIAAQIGSRRSDGIALGNIGTTQLRLGRLHEARDAMNRQLAIDVSIGDRRGQAAALGNLATLDALLGGAYTARSAQERRAAIALDEAGKNVLGESIVLANLAYDELRLGRAKDAVPLAQRAAALAQRLGSPSAIWSPFGTLAIAEAALGRRDDALAHFEVSVRAVESLRAGLTAEDDRSQFFAQRLSIYDAYVNYLSRLAARFPHAGYDRRAFEVFERRQGRTALEDMGKTAAHGFSGVPADVVAQDQTIDADLAAQARRLSTLEASGAADAGVLAAVRRRADDARRARAALDASLAQRYPEYYRLTHPLPAGVARLQRTLRPGEVLLAYAVLPASSVAWAIDRERFVGAPLPGLVDLRQRVARLKQFAATFDAEAFVRLSFGLYRSLVPEAFAAMVGANSRLFIVPSDALYGLPWEALVTREPPSGATPHYLLDDHPVSYVPSASLLVAVRAAQFRRPAAPRPFLAFADPVYPQDDEQSAPFAPLPKSLTEAQNAAVILGASSDSVKHGEEASRATVLSLNERGDLRTYRYILFATHAVVPGVVDGVTQPSIVLSHPEKPAGMLTMRDILGLRLDADVVTLSACDTGTQAEGPGAGISGLTRAFVYAGTATVTVTLNQVDDTAAALLTPAFYAALRRAEPAASALREAKLAILHGSVERLRLPYYWDPVVVFGDGDTVRSLAGDEAATSRSS